MYAIKIISNGHTYLYLAEEVSYSFKVSKSAEDFYANMENGDNVFIIGEVGDGDVEYIEMGLYDSSGRDDTSKVFYIWPTAWVYIMQEGKTIEAINVHEIKQEVKV